MVFIKALTIFYERSRANIIYDADMTMMMYLWDQHKRSLVGSPDAASNTLLVKEHMAVVCEDGL